MAGNENKILERIENVLNSAQDILQYAERREHGYTTFSLQRALECLNDGEILHLCTRMKQTIIDVTTPDKEYHKNAIKINPDYTRKDVELLRGLLKALREDYAGDFMKNINELLDADLFSDILDQAAHLLSQGYGRASAVVAGVALESHLKKMCEKNSIETIGEKGYVKAENLKNELSKKKIIDGTFNKSITGWLDIRNKAAHPDPEGINGGLIEPMIMGIRNLIEKHPA